MQTAVNTCSAALVAWLAIAAPALHAAAPGEDPVVLNKPVDYLRLPTAKPGTSTGLDTVTDIPINVKAKIARYEAMAMNGAPGVSTDADVVTTTTTSSTGMKRTCTQDLASNTNTGAFNRFGPQTKDQIVVLKGDLVNICR
ncbi:Uncharacterised protein [Delftia tsuruhatensis]|uniref:hypothetical protein n=1 Tax=Delftia tsuruhatensis TaxID=180282 RepID=UPI001E6F4597|nr:hypothetical protein [Delftia tsuruhatensis]CAB5720244.1 Uncharacterised protein [Delftia tsuruhatensis]CAC9685685.1 Uncharacterised protein [Delftia tsuruhatensis]